jgi:hypothetical protein
MLIDFIAMACVGGGVAGIVLFLRKVFKDRMPKWTMPAAIGAAMLIFSIWNEYSWFARTKSVLPSDVAMIATPRDTSPLRPWTYAIAPISRFMALDGTVMKSSAEKPHIKQAEIMLVQRWGKTQRVAVGFDCTAWRHTNLIEGASLSPAGVLTGSVWLEAAADDALMLAACT